MPTSKTECDMVAVPSGLQRDREDSGGSGEADNRVAKFVGWPFAAPQFDLAPFPMEFVTNNGNAFNRAMYRVNT
jgi:hypothetical protein